MSKLTCAHFIKDDLSVGDIKTGDGNSDRLIPQPNRSQAPWDG